MTLSETMAFIQEVSWQGCRPGLERITDLMHRIGDPQKELRYIHITGTNGKGSTAAMLATILCKAGYTVGLFTSPHLRFYNERIKINGQDISDEDLCAAAEVVKPAVDKMDTIPSEFERFTAMAFWSFRQRKCDIVVLEVGLGGALDSTNVICAPEVAVITNISLEHTEYLGSTISEIAATKSGIIKSGSDVVLCGQSQEVEQEVRSACASHDCQLCITDHSQIERYGGNLGGQLLRYRQRDDIHLQLLGTYQCENAAVALDTVDVLRRRGWTITEDAVYKGLAETIWPGRFEVLHQKPLFLVDGAHNPNGMEELVNCLNQYLPGKKLTFVIGVMGDKNYLDMVSCLVHNAKQFITVTPDNPRALPSNKLKQAIESVFPNSVISAGTVKNGVSRALLHASEDDVFCACGSLYMVGEIRDFFERINNQS